MVDIIGFNSPNEQTISEESKNFDCFFLGFSIFNSYYTFERIVQIIEAFKNTNFIIFLPETLSFHSDLYQGKYIKKIKDKNRRLHNKTLRALEIFGLNPSEKIIFFSTIENHPKYFFLIEKYKNLLKTDETLKQIIQKTLEELSFSQELEGKLTTNYILHELPTFLNIPSLLNVKSAAIIYHRNTILFDFLFKNNYQEENSAFFPMYFELSKN